MGAWGGGQGHQQQRGRRGPRGDGNVPCLSEMINAAFTNTYLFICGCTGPCCCAPEISRAQQQGPVQPQILIYLFVALPGLVAVHGISPVGASGGYSLFVAYRLLIAVASLVVEHWL